MPIDPVVVPDAPSVPDVDGVPSVNRPPGSSFTSPSTVSADSPSAAQALPPGQWGIFDKGGKAVINADTISEIEFKKGYRVSIAQQEKGAFVSYNKVADPYSGHLKYIQGGSPERRQAVLDAIDKAVTSLEFYTVVMPDCTYPSVNLVHYDFKRATHGGVTMLTVEVMFQEIRETATQGFTQTASPSGADSQHTGEQSGKDPTPSQNKTVEDNGPAPPDTVHPKDSIPVTPSVAPPTVTPPTPPTPVVPPPSNQQLQDAVDTGDVWKGLM